MTQTVPSVVNIMVTQSKPGHFILQEGPGNICTLKCVQF